MTALLERLNASRRFARSVYAPHKLALRQSVPSTLRAVGVTAPAPQPSSVSHSVAPRALGEIVPRAQGETAPRGIAATMPNVARGDAVPFGAERQPDAALNPVAFQPQAVTNLEPQESVNLELQESLSRELPVDDSAFNVAPLELAPDSSPSDAPESFAPDEPLLESKEAVVAQAPLEQPVAQGDPMQRLPSVPLELIDNAQRATASPAPAAAPLEPLVSADIPRATAAPLESVGERLAALREPAAVNNISTEIEQAETAFATPVQPLLEPAAPEYLEPPRTAPNLEVMAVPPVAETTAPASVGATAPVAADPPAPSLTPTQPSARGRVIEEFQARPPRNMPPRIPKVQPVEPAPQTSPDDAPRRSPEEWARLLRQRFAQPGDEAFDDAKAAAPATAPLEAVRLEAVRLETAPLETAPGDSSTAAAPNLEPTVVLTPPLPEAASALSSSQERLSAAAIRERSQAALQAIPEDMSQRTPRDWGMALVRRYASSEEATAIGIQAYRDPSDPNPVAAPAPRQSTPPDVPKVSSSRVVSATRSSSATSASTPVSSGAVSSHTSAPVQLEPAVSSPARRFVAPRLSVSSTAAGINATATIQTAPIQAQPNPTAPRSLEQPNRGLETADQMSALLEPNSTSLELQPDQPDRALASTLESEGFAEPEIGTEQAARAVTSPRPVTDSSPGVPAQDAARPDAPSAPPLEPVSSEAATLEPVNLEPVRLSGATRRFLEPLVGFDPNEVGVYTGETATRVTRELRADAAAQGGAVLLPDASNLETPVQLGLLAHELIHAAQQQALSSEATLELPAPVLENAPLELPLSAPESVRSLESAPRRFVPALGNVDSPSTDSRTSSTAEFAHPASNAVRQSSAALLTDISSFASEEDRALAAEARVVQIARSESPSADPAAASWNGLPAPWERLPSFDAPASDDAPAEPGVVSLIGAGLSTQGWGSSATTTNPGGYGGSVFGSSTGSMSSASSSGSSASNSAPQAAEVGRELPAEGGAAAAPDLEQLAKQVYDVLKRRLQSDRRRGGL